MLSGNMESLKAQNDKVIFREGDAVRICYKTFILNNDCLVRVTTRKTKGKNMWIKTEDNKNIWNLSNVSSVEIKERDGQHQVGLGGSFVFYTIKSFKYRQDAEKYLDELLEELNDE